MRLWEPLFPQRRLEKDIDEELEYHIERRTRENIAAGMSPSAAREEALRRFGDVANVRKACRRIGTYRIRAQRRVEMLDELRGNLRYAVRTLHKRPGFAAVTILSLALGVGGVSAMFSLVDGVLLRPLPFADPDRLVLLWGVETGMRTGSSAASYPDFVDFEEQNSVFEELAGWSSASFAVTGSEGEPMMIDAARVTYDLLPMLGVQPAIGRGFLPEEDRVGGEPVALISDGFWASRFGSRSDIVGQTLTLDGVYVTIIGVMPTDLEFPASVQVWIPAVPVHASDSRGQHRIVALGRLEPGINIELAEEEMRAIAARLEEEYPQSNTNRGARLETLHEAVVGNVRPALVMLLAAVATVLLIVCANVANLLLARSTTREKEVAIRTALGAGRRRLMRQLLTESLVLAVVGGALGVLLAVAAVGLVKAINPGNLPRLDEVAVNARVLWVALAVSLVTGVVFGFAPSYHSSKPDLNSSLKEGGRTSTQGGRKPRLRQFLVVAEMAMAVVLVAGAGLLINSFLQLQRVDPGFRDKGVLIAPLALPASRYDSRQKVTAFFDELLESIEALPGVESAAAAYRHPLSGGWETSFTLPGVYEPPEGQRPEARIRPITASYFQTVGIPLLQGRYFDEHDDDRAPGVVIINESFARAFFPEGDAIGHRLLRDQWWPDLPFEFEIVGIVGDVKMDGLTESTPWAMYYPHDHYPFAEMNVVVRAEGDPLAFAAAVRQRVWALDADLPVENVQALEQIRSESVARERFQTVLLGLFAVLALTLAALGIYGVMSYAVAQRTSEIGVRMSLGARANEVLAMIVGQGMKLAALGLVLGLVGAIATSRVMASLLFGVSPTDVPTFAAVTVVLAAVALLACVLPALRASRIDPVHALRSE